MRPVPAGSIIPAPSDFAGFVAAVLMRGERIRVAEIDMALVVVKVVVAMVAVMV